MSQIEIVILTRFKALLTDFLDELLNWMPSDEELITTRILVDTQLPMETVIEKFAEHLLPLKDQIKKRDETFFLDDPKVFGAVKDKSRILSLKNLWLNPEFTDVDKKNAWKWMDSFIECVSLYKQYQKKRLNSSN